MPSCGPPDLYLLTDLVDEYDLSPDWLYDQARSGELAAFKLGRRWFVRPADWEAFLTRRAAARVPS